MKQTAKARRLLERMAAIGRMERGKVCPMAGRPHHNHQTWAGGRNVARYVPDDEVRELREATENYRLFRSLAEQYADEIIRLTRLEREKNRRRKKT